MEFLPTQKAGIMLCYEGYMYTKGKIGKKSMNWRCVKDDVKKKDRCGGRLQTNHQNKNPELSRPHNHLPDHSKVYAAKMRHWMKQQALNNLETPAKIYKEALSQCSDEVKAHIPSPGTCKRLFQRSRYQGNYGILKKILEKSLYEYVKSYCEEKIEIQKSEIMKRTKELAQELKFNNFRYSAPWFKSWREKYHIKCYARVNDMGEEMYSIDRGHNPGGEKNTLDTMNSIQANASNDMESNNCQEGIQLQMECTDDFVANTSFQETSPSHEFKFTSPRLDNKLKVFSEALDDQDSLSDIYHAFDTLNKVHKTYENVPCEMQKGLDLVWRSLNSIFPNQLAKRTGLL